MSLLEESQVLDLCNMLTTIDVIHFPEFKISCFEYVSGYTFEQSIVSNTAPPEIEDPYAPPIVEIENTLSAETKIADPVADSTGFDGESKIDVKPKAIEQTTESSTTTTTVVAITTKAPIIEEEDENAEKQAGKVDQDLMNQLLLSK